MHPFESNLGNKPPKTLPTCEKHFHAKKFNFPFQLNSLTGKLCLFYKLKGNIRIRRYIYIYIYIKFTHCSNNEFIN